MKILYIGGAGRSGSTLLEMILGNVPGFFSTGEILDFWDHLSNDNFRCGCGDPIRSCQIWSKVLEAMNTEGELPINQIKKLKEKFDRTRNLPVIGLLKQILNFEYNQYLEYLKRLYTNVNEVTGGKIIVDSSKTPLHLYNLANITEIDIRVLHLVRDPRGVAFSWNKRLKEDFSESGNRNRMDKRSYLNSTIRWAVENRNLRLMKNRVNFYTVMRYEDFSRNPHDTLQNALDELEFLDADIKFLAAEQFDLLPTHSVGGNPLRLLREAIKIKPDRSWQDGIPQWQQLLLGLCIFPELIRYNYHLV